MKKEEMKNPDVITTEFRLDIEQFEKNMSRVISLMEEFENKLKSLTKNVTITITVDEGQPPE